MAGFGKNPRHGKRPPSSSSYFSTVSMVVLVAVCILGVWMLTSNSIIPSQATTHHHSRAAVSSNTPTSRSRKNPPPIIEDSQGDGEEAEEKPGSKLSISQQDSVGGEEESRSESNEKNEEDVEGRQGGEDTQQENLSGNEETQEQQVQETKEEDSNGGDGVVDEETKLQSDAQRSDEHQEGHAGREENREETQVQQNEHGGEESQQETQNIGTESEESQQETLKIGTESEESQQETQQNINWENQQETHQEQMEKNGSENQGETQDQILPTNDLENQQETKEEKETENIVDISEQQSQTEMDENHDRNQREESSNGEKSSEEGGNEAQWQPEQQKDVEGSSEHQQDMDNRSSHGTSEENQQQGEEKFSDPNANDLLPDASQSEVPNDSDGKKRPWATQADQSENEKERRKGSNIGNLNEYEWELCNVTAGPDYIPCLDNAKAIKKLHGFKHYEHRERHCPEESPTCLVPLPSGYKRSIEWPRSRDQIWYNNVPHTKLAEVKGHQNWVKVTGDYLTFPGGGTQFIHGALHYIDFIQQSVHDIAWGKHTRVILDVGCGVASFGGYLFDRDVLAMSFAPKDEHEAQVQLALERGIPAISAVMGSQRLPFPGRVFDLVHCARCRVPWHADGGTLLLELNRVLRPGGYFVWSATPVYQRLKEDVEIWKAMKSLTISMCWDLIAIKKDKLNSVGAAFFRKPVSNECYDNRKHHSPPMCKEDDDPNAAWYIPLKACMHGVPVDASERGSQWPEQWPRRVQVPPYWINGSQIGVYGKSAPDDFRSDYEHWKRVVTKSYLTGFGINWSKVRNVMDMRPVYGGFAAALKDLKVWVLNVVNIDAPDTLPIIFERGLFGIYHDWCESFSTYPRTYDLLHADHLFSQLNQRCKMAAVMAEVDRIVRPGGKLIVRDESRTISEIDSLLKSLHWEVRLTFSKDQEGILCAEKSDWRPEKYSDSS